MMQGNLNLAYSGTPGCEGAGGVRCSAPQQAADPTLTRQAAAIWVVWL
jgi:hypothetical protein